MKKTLFLLTKTFPFGTGEQYITNEVEYLAPFFEKIILYPNDHYSKNDKHDKILPANVEVLDLNSYLGELKKNSLADHLYVFKSILSAYFSRGNKNSLRELILNFKLQYALSRLFSVYLKKFKVDVNNTIFYSYWFHKSAILLSILKEKKQIGGFVSRAHSVDLYHEKWGLLSDEVKIPPFKDFKLRHADKVYAITEHGLNFLSESHPQLSSHFSMSYLGVKENQPKLEKNDFLQIVTCSHIDYNKRVHLLAEALCAVKHPVKWTHFGSGRFLDTVRELISKMPAYVQADIRGKTPNKEVLDFYHNNKVDLFVNLSIVEGLPVSIMEAMAHGIPILATSVYGTPEAVADKKNGFLLDVNFSLQELIDKLNYCCEHREELERMGQESRALYREKFNAEKNYTAFAKQLLN